MKTTSLVLFLATAGALAAATQQWPQFRGPNASGVAEEVAQLMHFLAGDESRFCTGGVYPVDGGMSAR